MFTFILIFCSVNASDYLIAEVLNVDSEAGYALINEIRKVAAATTTSKLWGIVQVSLQARLKTLPGQEILPDSGIENCNDVALSGPLRACEVLWACSR